jgi:hypothetical protein
MSTTKTRRCRIKISYVLAGTDIDVRGMTGQVTGRSPDRRHYEVTFLGERRVSFLKHEIDLLS